MAPILFVVVVFGGIFVLAIGLGAIAMRQRAAGIAAWQQFTQETGIAVTGDYPMMSFHGPWQGAMISLMHHVWRGHKGQRHYRHEIAAQIPMDTGDLAVDREGFFDIIGKAFGGQDIQIGDSVFDPAFRVRGSNEHQARAVLTTSARQALLQAVQAYPTIHIANGAVRISNQGIADARQVRGQVQALVSIANAFQAQGGAYAQPAAFNPYGLS